MGGDILPNGGGLRSTGNMEGGGGMNPGTPGIGGGMKGTPGGGGKNGGKFGSGGDVVR